MCVQWSVVIGMEQVAHIRSPFIPSNRTSSFYEPTRITTPPEGVQSWCFRFFVKWLIVNVQGINFNTKQAVP